MFKQQMTESTRKELCDFLFDCRRSSMFGDGLEDDYIRDGVTIVGLNQMTDEQLCEEFLTYSGESEELYQRAQAEMKVDLILLTKEDV